MAMFAPMIVGILAENRNARAGKEHLSGGLPYYNTFCCSDGRWIAVGAVEQKFQQKIKDVVGTTKYEDLKEFFLRHTQEECVELLSEACVSPILDILELPKQQQHQFRHMFHQNILRNPLGGSPIEVKFPMLEAMVSKFYVTVAFLKTRLPDSFKSVVFEIAMVNDREKLITKYAIGF